MLAGPDCSRERMALDLARWERGAQHDPESFLPRPALAGWAHTSDICKNTGASETSADSDLPLKNDFYERKAFSICMILTERSMFK